LPTEGLPVPDSSHPSAPNGPNSSAPNSITKPERILLAHIASAHGIRGELLLKTYTAAPADVAAYGPLSDTAGARQFSVRVVRVTPKGVIVRIKGVDDRNAAEALQRTALYVDRTRLPATATDEFYHTDLIGLATINASGDTFGRIAEVLDFGAGTILEIKLQTAAKTELVPFTKACVPTVDLASRQVTVVMPEVTLGEAEPGAVQAASDDPAPATE
jgi:16S rRNA processing protein RimM